jgi:hypothetical protein
MTKRIVRTTMSSGGYTAKILDDPKAKSASTTQLEPQAIRKVIQRNYPGRDWQFEPLDENAATQAVPSRYLIDGKLPLKYGVRFFAVYIDGLTIETKN